MRTSIVGTAFIVICLALAAGCGGGSSSPSTSATASPTSSPTTVPTGPPSTSAPISTATASAASVANGGYAVYVNFPASTSGTATMALLGSTTVGSNPPGITPYSGSGTTLIYVTFQPSATVTLPSYPQFQLQIPAAQPPQGYNFWGAIYTNDPTFPHGYDAWFAQFLGPASASGQTLYFPAPTTSLTFTANDYYVFALYEVPA
ncbi:MAG: hypothetical protein ABR949_05500 [Candidatus Aquilonibacter sp.]|jgi:hypothetical protein